MKGMHGMRPCGHGHGGHFHPAMVFFPLAFVLRIAAGAWVMITLVKLLEISTYSKALREMGDRLTEGEKANLEERIRQRLFS